MKKPQWIFLLAACLLTLLVYFFVRNVPEKKPVDNQQHSADDGHDHSNELKVLSFDTILLKAKGQLTVSQKNWLSEQEKLAVSSSNEQKMEALRQLAGFWKDSAGIFEPWAWYLSESARLENSEKSLTFAARLFLENLQNDGLPERRVWKALQAKDLFERSLKINPANDSAKVGLGGCYLFGNISPNPMEGIAKIREVTDKDSTNVYAQMMLVKGSVFSGQFDKAISRLETVLRTEPGNLEALLMMADLFEKKKDLRSAIGWYEKSLAHISQPELKTAVTQRIAELKKEDK